MKRMFLSPAVATVALLAGCAMAPAATPSQDSLLGTWRVVSYVGVPDGGTPVDIWGKAPRGYVVITPTRFLAILTAQDRKIPTPPFSAQDFANSFVTQISYAGPYRLDGNRLVTSVDASSAVTWVGTEQVREYRLEGRRLHLSTLPGPFPPGIAQLAGKTGRSHLVWERLE